MRTFWANPRTRSAAGDQLDFFFFLFKYGRLCPACYLQRLDPSDPLSCLLKKGTSYPFLPVELGGTVKPGALLERRRGGTRGRKEG